jgi:hypothetical protein
VTARLALSDLKQQAAESGTTTPRAALLKSAGIRVTASDDHGEGVEWVAKDPFVLID